jgi:hypothetical protein
MIAQLLSITTIVGDILGTREMDFFNKQSTVMANAQIDRPVYCLFLLKKYSISTVRSTQATRIAKVSLPQHDCFNVCSTPNSNSLTLYNAAKAKSPSIKLTEALYFLGRIAIVLISD